MTIYVDELPKSCEKCKFYEYEIEHNGEWGFETHRRMCKINGSLIQGICPLKSLTDYTKKVRKEVVQEIKEKYKQKMANALDDDEETGHLNCDAVLEELLEEIGFDEVLELYRSQGKWYA